MTSCKGFTRWSQLSFFSTSASLWRTLHRVACLPPRKALGLRETDDAQRKRTLRHVVLVGLFALLAWPGLRASEQTPPPPWLAWRGVEKADAQLDDQAALQEQWPTLSGHQIRQVRGYLSEHYDDHLLATQQSKRGTLKYLLWLAQAELSVKEPRGQEILTQIRNQWEALQLPMRWQVWRYEEARQERLLGMIHATQEEVDQLAMEAFCYYQTSGDFPPPSQEPQEQEASCLPEVRDQHGMVIPWICLMPEQAQEIKAFLSEHTQGHLLAENRGAYGAIKYLLWLVKAGLPVKGDEQVQALIARIDEHWEPLQQGVWWQSFWYNKERQTKLLNLLGASQAQVEQLAIEAFCYYEAPLGKPPWHFLDGGEASPCPQLKDEDGAPSLWPNLTSDQVDLIRGHLNEEPQQGFIHRAKKRAHLLAARRGGIGTLKYLVRLSREGFPVPGEQVAQNIMYNLRANDTPGGKLKQKIDKQNRVYTQSRQNHLLRLAGNATQEQIDKLAIEAFFYYMRYERPLDLLKARLAQKDYFHAGCSPEENPYVGALKEAGRSFSRSRTSLLDAPEDDDDAQSIFSSPDQDYLTEHRQGPPVYDSQQPPTAPQGEPSIGRSSFSPSPTPAPPSIRPARGSSGSRQGRQEKEPSQPIAALGKADKTTSALAASGAGAALLLAALGAWRTMRGSAEAEQHLLEEALEDDEAPLSKGLDLEGAEGVMIAQEA